MTNKARTKPPTMARRVSCDDLTVVVGGETYFPHYGEWVEYKGRPSVGLYIKLLGMNSASEDGLKELAKYVTAWNWTDDDNKPYPAPSAEVFTMLPTDELKWLLITAGNDVAPLVPSGGTGST